MAITAATSSVELNDLMEQGTFTTTVSDWVGDKGKYFCEAAAIGSYYMSQVPVLYGRIISPNWGTASANWVGAEEGLKGCKKILAFPGAIKGAMALYEKLQKGGESVRNLLGDACYVIGDTIDGFTGFQSFGIFTNPPQALVNCLERVKTFTKLKNTIGFFKDITGIYGLGNTAYNAHVDIGKLRQIDLTKVTHPEIKDTKKALELKKNWVTAEIDNKWQDRLRCLTACAMCALGAGKSAVLWLGFTAVAYPITSMILTHGLLFAVLGTIGIYSKYNMYASKVESGFWQNRYAELIPTQSSKSQLLKASK